MASALWRPWCALKLIERVPQQIIYLRKRNKSRDPLLWTKSKIWPSECSTCASPCKVDPLTHPDEQLTRPTVNLKPKSSHPPFFNIWKNQIKKCSECVRVFMFREYVWLWNNNHFVMIFFFFLPKRRRLCHPTHTHTHTPPRCLYNCITVCKV